MPTRAQQILIKRAQREAGLSDSDYREALETVSGCRSSTDPRLTDRQLDLLIAYFEAIHWRAVDAGTLQASCKADAIFRERGYWAQKNTRAETSRDRYSLMKVGREVASLEAALGALGFGPQYCAAIRRKVTNGSAGAYAEYLYKSALERTLRAKQAKEFASEQLALINEI